jgi:hypothetical protein
MGPNPARYRELQKPYESPEFAEQQLTEFCEAVEELRTKFGVAQVLVVIEANVVYPPKRDDDEATEGSVSMVCHFGDNLHAERMAAFALGRLSAERQELIAEVAAKAAKSISLKGSRKRN